MNIIFKYMFFVAIINNDYLIVRPNTQKILLQPIIFFPKSKNTGIKSARAMMEKIIQPMTSPAKANQKTDGNCWKIWKQNFTKTIPSRG